MQDVMTDIKTDLLAANSCNKLLKKVKQSCCDMSVSVPQRKSTPFGHFPTCCCDPLWPYSVSLVFSTCCRTAHTRPRNRTDTFCQLSATRPTVNHIETLVSTAVSASHGQPV